MPTPHKHAALIKQWADDLSRTVWVWSESNKHWQNIDTPSWVDSCHYAIGEKPTRPPRKMCVLAGVEFPEPETAAPAHRTTYYFPTASNQCPVGSSEWRGGEGFSYQWYQLENGLVHLTREAAEQHSKALLAANKQAIESAK